MHRGAWQSCSLKTRKWAAYTLHAVIGCQKAQRLRADTQKCPEHNKRKGKRKYSHGSLQIHTPPHTGVCYTSDRKTDGGLHPSGFYSFFIAKWIRNILLIVEPFLYFLIFNDFLIMRWLNSFLLLLVTKKKTYFTMCPLYSLSRYMLYIQTQFWKRCNIMHFFLLWHIFNRKQYKDNYLIQLMSFRLKRKNIQIVGHIFSINDNVSYDRIIFTPMIKINR